MKIERVNDHQIRCTLTREDLADRELKLSELAYGTEKVKNLFRDMMQQASYEFGFEAEDIPLMIEAIPLNSECIILIITKVEDPEELDTRFSKFAPSVHDESVGFEEIIETLVEGADEILDLFKRIHSSHQQQIAENGVTDANGGSTATGGQGLHRKVPSPASHQLTRIYSFDSLNTVIKIARILASNYSGVNSLYKRHSDGRFVLVINKGNIPPADFNKICNVLSEYGVPEKTISAAEAYLEEHGGPLIRNTAIQDLAEL
jgi:adapter protein MecA 1/2